MRAGRKRRFGAVEVEKVSHRLPAAEVEVMRRLAREAAYRLGTAVDYVDVMRAAYCATYRMAPLTPAVERLMDADRGDA